MVMTKEERRLKKNAQSLAWKKKRYYEDPEWRAKHIVQSKACGDIRKATIPGYKEKIDAHTRDYHKTPAGKISQKKSDAKYSKTPKAKAIHARLQNHWKNTPSGKVKRGEYKDRRKRNLGSELINSWFKGCNRHHINSKQIICIPAEDHRKFSGHNHNKSKDPKFIAVNKFAFQYLTDTIKQL